MNVKKGTIVDEMRSKMDKLAPLCGKKERKGGGTVVDEGDFVTGFFCGRLLALDADRLAPVTAILVSKMT